MCFFAIWANGDTDSATPPPPKGYEGACDYFSLSIGCCVSAVPRFPLCADNPKTGAGSCLSLFLLFTVLICVLSFSP
jgi:hypothetical protein